MKETAVFLILALALLGCQEKQYVRVLGVAEGLGAECILKVTGEYESKDPHCLLNSHVIVSVDYEKKVVRCGIPELDCEVTEEK